MNKAQQKAQKKYDENKQLVKVASHLSSLELCAIAQQQDRLYMAIYQRQDSKIFNGRRSGNI